MVRVLRHRVRRARTPALDPPSSGDREAARTSRSREDLDSPNAGRQEVPTVLKPLHKLDPATLHHPVVVDQVQQRASDVQLRIADRITSFAGSMNFVYLHVALFALWMLVFEKSPWPTLTLIVSLEAIFLSTFVMIGQNRQAAFQQAKADQDYRDVSTLLRENTELTRLSHDLAQEVHRILLAQGTDDTP
jgi:hypothetical protein